MRITITSSIGEVADTLEFEIRKLGDYRTKVSRKGRPPLSLWDRIAPEWRASRKRMFETAGVSAGTPWLSYDQTEENDWYKWYKAIVYGNGRTLTLFDVLRWEGSDILMRSFTEPAHRSYYQAETATTWEGGSKLPYAATNDQGIGNAPSRLGGHPIPKRRLTGIGSDFRLAVRECLVGYASDFGAVLGDQLDAAGARMLPLA